MSKQVKQPQYYETKNQLGIAAKSDKKSKHQKGNNPDYGMHREERNLGWLKAIIL